MPITQRSKPTGHEHGHVHPVATGEANPVLVEVTRGGMVESRHRAAVAVVDAAGHVVLSAGEVEQVVYGRSAIKPLQTLALIETGAAEAFGCNDAEIALASASHAGEPVHVATVEAWLERIGCGVEDLECGAHLPYDEASAEAMIRAGKTPTAAYNNCSGKHTGFLTLAKHLGVPTKGYIRFDHPVQQSLLGILEMMTGLDLRDAPRGIDGCGIPQIGIPLGNIALAMARLADPADQPERRQAAAKRVLSAMAAEPVMVAGSKKFCTKVIAATQGHAIVKTGAEGVFCASLPDSGLGIALKVDDGATRASEVVMGHVLTRLEAIDAAASEALAEVLVPTVRNRVGLAVGEVRPASGGPL